MKKLIIFLVLVVTVIFGGYKFLKYKAEQGIVDVRQKVSEAVDRSTQRAVLVGLEIYYDKNKTLPPNIAILGEQNYINPSFVERVRYEYVNGKNARVCLKFDPKEYGEKQCLDFIGK